MATINPYGVYLHQSVWCIPGMATINPCGVYLPGYNDKMPAFVSAIGGALARHLPSDETKLERYKDTIARDLTGFDVQQPYEHAAFYNALYTSTPAFRPKDVLTELNSVTLADLQVSLPPSLPPSLLFTPPHSPSPPLTLSAVV